MRIRKPVYELTPADLLEYPAWEWALDEEGDDDQDETTVRPANLDSVMNAEASGVMVRAKFILADGTQLIGFLRPPKSDDRDLDYVQPVIVTTSGQVKLFYGIFPPEPEERARKYTLLGKTACEVFPLTFHSDLDGLNQFVEGRIEGFLFYKREPDAPLYPVNFPIDFLR